MRLFHKTNYDFMGWRRRAISASLMCILAGILSLVVKGGPGYTIDFLGGTELQVQFREAQETQRIRDVLARMNHGDAEIKQFGSPREFLIRISESRGGFEATQQIMVALGEAFPGDQPTMRGTYGIGPRVGHEMRDAAIWAVCVTLVLLLIYIGIRFDFVFGVGAVIALFHDVLITLGLFSLLNLEIGISVVAAFLTLVGYSLNDTIVVFDRIRENFGKRHRQHLSTDQLINISINETLSRTVVTGITTLMVILVFLFLGGIVLRDFFICLLFGILVGTYSSIFIAAPVVAKWHSRRDREKTVHPEAGVRFRKSA